MMEPSQLTSPVDSGCLRSSKILRRAKFEYRFQAHEGLVAYPKDRQLQAFHIILGLLQSRSSLLSVQLDRLNFLARPHEFQDPLVDTLVGIDPQMLENQIEFPFQAAIVTGR